MVSDYLSEECRKYYGDQTETLGAWELILALHLSRFRAMDSGEFIPSGAALPRLRKLRVYIERETEKEEKSLGRPLHVLEYVPEFWENLRDLSETLDKIEETEFEEESVEVSELIEPASVEGI